MNSFCSSSEQECLFHPANSLSLIYIYRLVVAANKTQRVVKPTRFWVERWRMEPGIRNTASRKQERKTLILLVQS